MIFQLRLQDLFTECKKHRPHGPGGLTISRENVVALFKDYRPALPEYQCAGAVNDHADGDDIEDIVIDGHAHGLAG